MTAAVTALMTAIATSFDRISQLVVFTFDDIHSESVHAQERFRAEIYVGVSSAPELILRGNLAAMIYHLQAKSVQFTLMDWVNKRATVIDAMVDAVSMIVGFLLRDRPG